MYALQSGTSVAYISQSAIEQFMGTLMLMGVYRVPQMRMFWQEPTRCPAVADNFPRKKFENVKRNLHFNNNVTMPVRNSSQFDKLYKIRPLLENIVSKFRVLPLQEKVSIDEQMIPTHGRSPVRQYMPNKPHKWGIKVWALCGVTGMCYNIDVYTGKSLASHGEYGLGGNIVLQLLQDVVPKCENHKIAFDNYFTSLPLLHRMHVDGWLAVGTIRGNRLRGCASSLRNESELKRRGRGSHDWRCDTQKHVAVVCWYDKAAIQLASNYINGEDGDPVLRYSQLHHDHIEIPCPKIVKVYNENMGGVDLCDALVSYYRVQLKSRKWYHHIFFHLINLCITNSWLLYREDYALKGLPENKRLSLLHFQASIANALLKQNKPSPITSAMSRKRGRPPKSQLLSASSSAAAVGVGRKPAHPNPGKAARLDLVDHFAIFGDRQQRCRLCSDKKLRGQTFALCSKCEVPLCILPDRNCFYDFHH